MTATGLPQSPSGPDKDYITLFIQGVTTTLRDVNADLGSIRVEHAELKLKLEHAQSELGDVAKSVSELERWLNNNRHHVQSLATRKADRKEIGMEVAKYVAVAACGAAATAIWKWLSE